MLKFLNIFKTIVQPASDAYQKRAELKTRLEEVRIESEIAAELAWKQWRIANIQADAAWELESIKNSGWKDDLVIVLLAIPLVLVFCPWTAGYVLTGFEILERTPEWYRWLTMMIFAAVYGIRLWRRPTQ